MLAVDESTEHVRLNDSDLLQAEATYGTSRVVCFSPRHDLTVAEMTAPDLRGVVDALREQSIELSAKYAVVQVFENKGTPTTMQKWRMVNHTPPRPLSDEPF